MRSLQDILEPVCAAASDETIFRGLSPKFTGAVRGDKENTTLSQENGPTAGPQNNI